MQLTPEYEAKRRAYQASAPEDSDTANCLPPGMPGIMTQPYPMEFLMTPGKVTIVIEAYTQVRHIYTDGRKLPEDPDPKFFGTSVGRWEGDTLVVETVGFSPSTNLRAEFRHSDKMRIVERFRLADPDNMTHRDHDHGPGCSGCALYDAVQICDVIVNGQSRNTSAKKTIAILSIAAARPASISLFPARIHPSKDNYENEHNQSTSFRRGCYWHSSLQRQVCAAAHHSFAAFNMTDEKTVTGTVNRVEWTNPHIWIWIDVPNAKGAQTRTDFEGMSPNFLERRGWTRTTLKARRQDHRVVSVLFATARTAACSMTGKMETGKDSHDGRGAGIGAVQFTQTESSESQAGERPRCSVLGREAFKPVLRQAASKSFPAAPHTRPRRAAGFRSLDH